MRALLLVTLLLVATGSAFAHHQFSSEFDATKRVTLTGKVVKMAWVNPHAWLYIEVTEPDGKVVPWALEFGIPRTLIRQGWRKEDLPPGATVTIEGFLAKNGSKTANASKVTLAGGRVMFAGSSYGGDAAR
jgi:uncharacterized membrane protein YgdD (TMEM256/DUF423 family)